jgi:hypothetical protein
MFTCVPRFIKFARVVKVPYYLSVYFNDFGLFYGLDNLLCYTNWTSYWLLIGQSELLLVGVLNMTRRRTRTFPQEATIYSWIEPYPELMYESTRRLIYCTKCENNFGCRQSSVKRHIEGPLHNRSSDNGPKHFYDDLIEFLILCNIPWQQTENPAFVIFFQKYICCTCAKMPFSKLVL